jgi:hypothetical protein
MRKGHLEGLRDRLRAYHSAERPCGKSGWARSTDVDVLPDDAAGNSVDLGDAPAPAGPAASSFAPFVPDSMPKNGEADGPSGAGVGYRHSGHWLLAQFRETGGNPDRRVAKAC